mmetsp:Transcript_16061/g.64872  ORF Transcript_16061/g.64872 Transcript_16061/m.64872 type:complete len:477 (+) Transcript_16061:690-2120(+)
MDRRGIMSPRPRIWNAQDRISVRAPRLFEVRASGRDGARDLSRVRRELSRCLARRSLPRPRALRARTTATIISIRKSRERRLRRVTVRRSRRGDARGTAAARVGRDGRADVVGGARSDVPARQDRGRPAQTRRAIQGRRLASRDPRLPQGPAVPQGARRRPRAGDQARAGARHHDVRRPPREPRSGVPVLRDSQSARLPAQRRARRGLRRRDRRRGHDVRLWRVGFDVWTANNNSGTRVDLGRQRADVRSDGRRDRTARQAQGARGSRRLKARRAPRRPAHQVRAQDQDRRLQRRDAHGAGNSRRRLGGRHRGAAAPTFGRLSLRKGGDQDRAAPESPPPRRPHLRLRAAIWWGGLQSGRHAPRRPLDDDDDDDDIAGRLSRWGSASRVSSSSSSSDKRPCAAGSMAADVAPDWDFFVDVDDPPADDDDDVVSVGGFSSSSSLAAAAVPSKQHHPHHRGVLGDINRPLWSSSRDPR